MGSFGLKVAHTLLNLVISIVLARALAPDGYGIYAFTFSVMTLLAAPVQFGLPTLLVREVARYQYAARWDLLRGILLRANQAVFLLSLVVGLIAATAAWRLADQVNPTQLATFAWALLLLPLIALNRLREAALHGLRRVVMGQLPEKLLLPVVLLVLLGVALLTSGVTPPLAMALYCAAAGLAFVAGAVMLLRALPPEVRTARAHYNTPTWVRSVLPLSLLTGVHVINGQTDIFMLGLLATSEEVGLYRVAFSGAALVIFTFTAMNMVLAPNIARLHSAGDRERLQRMVTLSARLNLMAALPVASTFILFGGPFLEAVFGAPYRESNLALAILCVAQLVTVAVGPVHVILNMTGYERETVKGVTCSALINVTLNAVLIPFFGLEGAAMATAISIVVMSIILFRALWVRTGIWSLATGLPARTESS